MPRVEFFVGRLDAFQKCSCFQALSVKPKVLTFPPLWNTATLVALLLVKTLRTSFSGVMILFPRRSQEFPSDDDSSIEVLLTILPPTPKKKTPEAERNSLSDARSDHQRAMTSSNDLNSTSFDNNVESQHITDDPLQSISTQENQLSDFKASTTSSARA